MRRNTLPALVAITGTLLSMQLGTTAAVAKVHSFSAARQHHGVLTFKVRGLDAQRVRSARVTVRGRRALRVSLRRVRRAAKTRVLRIRMPRSWRRGRIVKPRVRAAHHRAGHKLRVVTDTTRPVGSAPLGDADAAARVRRSSWEPRPNNYGPNHRVPTAAELDAYYNASGTGSQVPGPYRYSVTGKFTGTTDEILQWGAHKWGIDEDILRAVAVTETGWDQSWVGDNGYSYGLMQIKRPTGEQWTGWNGSHPLSEVSTAFNVDFYGAVIRRCYNGDESWRPAPYAPGDVWGCVGSWYSGGWYDQGAQNYIGATRTHLADKKWAQPGF